MTRKDVIEYLSSKAGFRRQKASESRPGTWPVIKNEIYAGSLEKVIEYVASLPDDDPTLQKLEQMGRDFSYHDDSDVHNATIHCSLGKSLDVAKWFASWANMLKTVDERGDPCPEY